MKPKPELKNNLTAIIRISAYCCLILYVVQTVGCNSTKEKDNRGKNPNGRNDDWGYVGAGGGGAMFNPEVSPYNPDIAFVSCDIQPAGACQLLCV